MADLVDHCDETQASLAQSAVHRRVLRIEQDVARLRGRVLVVGREAREIAPPEHAGAAGLGLRTPPEFHVGTGGARHLDEVDVRHALPERQRLPQPDERRRRPSVGVLAVHRALEGRPLDGDGAAVAVFPGAAADQAVDPGIAVIGRCSVDEDSGGCAGHGSVLRDESEAGMGRVEDQRDGEGAGGERRTADRPVAQPAAASRLNEARLKRHAAPKTGQAVLVPVFPALRRQRTAPQQRADATTHIAV